MIDYRNYTHLLGGREIAAWNNSGVKGVRTHDLRDAGAAGSTNWAIKLYENWSLCQYVIYV